MCLPGMYSALFFSFLSLLLSSNGLMTHDVTDEVVKNITICSKDVECTYNAYCHLGRCTCKTGFQPYRESNILIECFKGATDINDYCEKDIQCQAAFGDHSFCKHICKNLVGKCSCQKYSHFIDGRCYKTAYIGDTCQVNENCVIKSKHLRALCNQSRCVCPPKHYPVKGGTDCIPTSELGGPCITSDGCITPSSECRRGICKCKREYMPIYDNKTCLLVAKRISDPCIEDGECLMAHQNIICHNTTKVCKCHEGAHELDGTCWETSMLLEACRDTNECRSEPERGLGIECSLGVCQCSQGYHMEDNKECVMWETGTGSVKELTIFLLLASLVTSSTSFMGD